MHRVAHADQQPHAPDHREHGHPHHRHHQGELAEGDPQQQEQHAPAGRRDDPHLAEHLDTEAVLRDRQPRQVIKLLWGQLVIQNGAQFPADTCRLILAFNRDVNRQRSTVCRGQLVGKQWVVGDGGTQCDTLRLVLRRAHHQRPHFQQSAL